LPQVRAPCDRSSHAFVPDERMLCRKDHKKQCLVASNMDMLATVWDWECRSTNVCGEDPTATCILDHHGQNVGGTQRKKMLLPSLEAGLTPYRILDEANVALPVCKRKHCVDAESQKIDTCPPCGGFYKQGHVTLLERDTTVSQKEWEDREAYGTIYPDMLRKAMELLGLDRKTLGAQCTPS
jgi:hypothetical protein